MFMYIGGRSEYRGFCRDTQASGVRLVGVWGCRVATHLGFRVQGLGASKVGRTFKTRAHFAGLGTF